MRLQHGDTILAQHASPRGTRRRRPRVSCARVRSWTGRANMSRSTDSRLPEFVTAGTRRTRVSEMRALPRIADALVNDAPRAPLPAIPQRRHARRARRSHGSG